MPGVWRVTTPLAHRPREVHAYLVELGAGEWMLVDGGADTHEGWTALETGVLRVAGGWHRIRVQVVTHMHTDHIGLAPRVARASDAGAVMHVLDSERAAGAAIDPGAEAAYRAGVLREAGAPPDLWPWAEPRGAAAPPPVRQEVVGDGGRLPDVSGWRWLWTPGHTAGHISLLREADAVLVAGDAVLPTITPTLGVNRQRADPIADYADALARIAASGAKAVLPAHGEPIDGPDLRLAALRHAVETESGAVAALLSDEPHTAWEVTSRRYTGRTLPPGVWVQALRETMAHLNHLVLLGGACREPGSDGAVGFRTVRTATTWQ